MQKDSSKALNQQNKLQKLQNLWEYVNYKIFVYSK